jgi:hypothetical protein
MIIESGQERSGQQSPVRRESVFNPLRAGTGDQFDFFELEKFRKKIDSKEYLDEAIQRIALVLSNELLDISRKGIYQHERKRRK